MWNRIARTTLLLICCWNTQAAVSQAERPNIVLLFTDDQSFFSTGATGNVQVKTPEMDRLAADGLLFTHHYNSTAICMGSRASIMTGMYEYKTGCNFSHGPMRPATFAKSFPVLLRRAGYRTGFAGKFGFAVTDGKSERDNSFRVLPVDAFDAWAGGTGQTSYVTKKNKYLARYADRFPHATRAYGAFAQDFIRECAGDDRPFCLTLFFKSPHRPFTPDPYFDDVYKDVVFEKPTNYGREHGQHLSKQSRLGRQYLTFFRDMGFDPDHYQETMRAYHQLVHGVDYAIGMLREELERQGVAQNTVIFHTSDNGFFCGAHGFGGKVLPYEEGSKVPLVIYDPRRAEPGAKRTATTVTGTVDVAPTILDLAGHPIPENMDGRSLTAVLDDPSHNVREVLPLFQVWGAPPTFSMSVVTKEHKYIYWCYGDKMEPAEELFDLANDPMEMRNVAQDAGYADVLTTMRAHYADALAHWKANAVPYHHYQPFGLLFDPTVGWHEKRELVPSHMWKQYTSLAKQLGLPEEAWYDYDRVLESAQ